MLDADIRDYFSRIDRTKLLTLVRQRVSDRRVLRLLRLWLAAGVMAAGQVRRTLAGTPQGGVISPLLSNIFLHVLDRVWEDRWAHLGTLVRYADDFVVMCDTKASVEAARERLGLVLARLGLELHPEKTRVVDLTDGREGFDFLGCHLHKRMSGPIWARSRRRVYYLHRWPSRRAMKQVRARVRGLTPRGRCHTDLASGHRRREPGRSRVGAVFPDGECGEPLRAARPVCGTAPARPAPQAGGSRLAAGRAAAWQRPFFEALGLVRLRGTIRYPGAVHAST